MPDTKTTPGPGHSGTKSWPFTFLIFSVLLPIVAALVLYRLDPLDPAPLPQHELAGPLATAPARNGRLLDGSEFVGAGSLLGPEDVAYDSKSGLIYTGCADGWIKRVTVNESGADCVVENWVNTGGRPLGLAHGLHNEVIVADAVKGLLSINEEGVVELLTNEAEGVKLNLTNFVDVAKDGMLYFSDASYKYSLKDVAVDLLEGKPNGRLLSYNPVTKQTKVLLSHLYFANGVALSPDQSSVIFCETTMRRCRKYHLQGKDKGKVEKFIDRLPGLPDNIRYDGDDLYWIALVREITPFWDLAYRYPFIRKGLGILQRYIASPLKEKNSGVLAVDLEGKPVAHYYDPGLSLITSGVKIGNHLYCGSVVNPHIVRLDLEQYPARSTK